MLLSSLYFWILAWVRFKTRLSSFPLREEVRALSPYEGKIIYVAHVSKRNNLSRARDTLSVDKLYNVQLSGFTWFPFISDALTVFVLGCELTKNASNFSHGLLWLIQWCSYGAYVFSMRTYRLSGRPYSLRIVSASHPKHAFPA